MMPEESENANDATSQDDDENVGRVRSNGHSSEEEEWEGRFHGPDSSWRFYTEAERSLASSLDQVENNDLSAH
nr:hypothetical protein [Tanacetum cinerariifolium]